MFVYEKNGKLNIAFQNTQVPPEVFGEEPDVSLEMGEDGPVLTVGESQFPSETD